MPDDSAAGTACAHSQTSALPAPAAHHIPTTPYAMIWKQLKRHGHWRITAIIALVVVGALVENL